MSGVPIDVADPVIVDERIRPLAQEVARELWATMSELSKRDRVGRSQLYGLVEIAQNEPTGLSTFISKQRDRTKNIRENARKPHEKFWSTLGALLAPGGSLTKLIEELGAGNMSEDMSKKERKAVTDALFALYVPICMLMLAIEYQYLEAKSGA